jgi:hypothetical protein
LHTPENVVYGKTEKMLYVPQPQDALDGGGGGTIVGVGTTASPEEREGHTALFQQLTEHVDNNGMYWKQSDPFRVTTDRPSSTIFPESGDRYTWTTLTVV